MDNHQLNQAAAITDANNRTREAELPTYSELVEALRKLNLKEQASRRINDATKSDDEELAALCNAAALLARIPA